VKLHEIVHPAAKDVKYVHRSAGIMRALTASLMYDWLIVDIDADPITEDTEKETKALAAVIKKVTRKVPASQWLSHLSCIIDTPEQLKKLLDSINVVFGSDEVQGGDWPWMVTITCCDDPK